MRSCLSCGHHQFRRIAREGVMEWAVMPLLGLFPWTCSNCGKKIYLHKRQGLQLRPGR